MPQEPLSRFYGLELSDDDRSWTLKIEDGVAKVLRDMSTTGNLISFWNLVEVVKMNLLDSSRTFSPGNSYCLLDTITAVVVGHSMFLLEVSATL